MKPSLSSHVPCDHATSPHRSFAAARCGRSGPQLTQPNVWAPSCTAEWIPVGAVVFVAPASRLVPNVMPAAASRLRSGRCHRGSRRRRPRLWRDLGRSRSACHRGLRTTIGPTAECKWRESSGPRRRSGIRGLLMRPANGSLDGLRLSPAHALEESFPYVAPAADRLPGFRQSPTSMP